MEQAFLDEATENAEAFSATMVELERTSDEEAAAMVNDLFRRAHNLKGMAAMEEQPVLAQLAHAAEDLLSRYRDDGGRPSGEEVDALLAAADTMEAMVRTLAGGGAPAPADDLQARLRALADADGSEDRPGGGASGDGQAARPAVVWDDDVESGLRVELVDGTQAPKARARLVLRAAGELADVAGTDPPELEGVDATNLSFIIGLRSVADQAALLAKIDAFREVHAVAAVELARRLATPPAPPVAPPVTEAPTPVSTTVRVDVDRLDQLLDLVGELVVEKNRLLSRASAVDDRPLHESVAAIADVVGDLREVVSSVRMVSLEATFTRMQRVARDVARELGKPVQLEVIGAETELDRSVVDEVMQPLVHLVRNAIDHGVEDPDDRRSAGKDETGHVQLTAEQQGPEVVIEVSDDGGGIDADRLAAKAVEKGLVAADAIGQLTPTQVYDLMFLPGFTSRDQAGLVSGRGVGLDVVRSTVEALGGSIAVRSSPQDGTTFSLHFPLSLVVMDALLVSVGGDTWALPVTRCEETIRMFQPRGERIGHAGTVEHAGMDDHAGMDEQAGTVEHRDGSLPVIRGDVALARSPEPGRAPFGVVLRESGGRYVLTVDRLVGRAEVVVKPAPRGIPGTEHIAGVTVLAEGEVALVPDLALIVRQSRAARDVTVP